MYGVGSGSGAGVGGGFPHPGAPTPTGFTPGGNPIRQVVCVSVRACVRACMQAGHAYMRRAYAWTLRARCVALGQGSVDCPFYVKTGDCKFGATCKFNHPPEMFGVGAGGQGAAGLGAAGGGTPAVQISYTDGGNPIRPGQEECQFYVKNGHCKFGPSCKYHHPPEFCGTGAGGAALTGGLVYGFSQTHEATGICLCTSVCSERVSAYV